LDVCRNQKKNTRGYATLHLEKNKAKEQRPVLTFYTCPPLMVYNIVSGVMVSVFDWFMVFKAIFNNISVISWWSVLFVEDTRVTGENHRPIASQ
jgi:hypothetical protein